MGFPSSLTMLTVAIGVFVITWYVAIVTGLISFSCPEYSPISSAVSEVRRSSSSRHCRADTVFVTRISVVVSACAIAPAPTSGSTS